MRLHGKSVAFAATSLGAALINPVFSFYYVKIYISRFHVSQQWFQFAQVIFMIWNAINDPLFGCLQDNLKSWSIFHSRRHSILYGAPLFAIAFIISWFPWTDYDSTTSSWVAGVQLTVVLCFYDALFTFVLLAQCALLAELSPNQADRVRMVRYGQAAALIGSVSVLICETTSASLEHYTLFQLTCIVLGMMAGACFVYTGLRADTQFDGDGTVKDDVVSAKIGSDSLSGCEGVCTVLQQTRQIFAQRSFVSFVLVNFCQIYHTTFLANFSNIIGDYLLGDGLSPSMKSLFYGLLFVLPQLLIIIGAPVVASVGYYRIIRASFLLKICCGLAFFLIGCEHAWVVALFFLVESANANATFSLFGLCLSDIIDIDMQQHQRLHPLSSMVFGLNALVTKPAISLAPMLTVALLGRYGYTSLSPGTSALTTTTPSPSRGPVDLTAAMFHTTAAVPIVTGLLQLVLWHMYSLRDSHKHHYKRLDTAC